MNDFFDDSISEYLDPDSYQVDFRQRWHKKSLWKLERSQYFGEPNNPSWVALAENRWGDSLKLIEDNREEVKEYYSKAIADGASSYRVRVVEKPIQPYVQWEFHYLRLGTAAGAKIRVIYSDQLKEQETTGQLPELIAMGNDTVYKVVYTDAGVPQGARRIIDRDYNRRCSEFIQGLYKTGEDMDVFFEREIKDLPAPRFEVRSRG